MSKDKKALQLGMNPSTASHRLVKDLLWYYVAQHKPCYHCKKEMSRDTFSIEHIYPWLDSGNPIGMYFRMDNVTFSHLSCNSGAARSARKKYDTPEEVHRAKLDHQNQRRKIKREQ